jgi:hypothetical protein
MKWGQKNITPTPIDQYEQATKSLIRSTNEVDHWTVTRLKKIKHGSKNLRTQAGLKHRKRTYQNAKLQLGWSFEKKLLARDLSHEWAIRSPVLSHTHARLEVEEGLRTLHTHTLPSTSAGQLNSAFVMWRTELLIPLPLVRIYTTRLYFARYKGSWQVLQPQLLLSNPSTQIWHIAMLLQ